jgi:hypothetical protein
VRFRDVLVSGVITGIETGALVLFIRLILEQYININELNDVYREKTGKTFHNRD